MTGEQIFGLILILGVFWGCGAVFFGIGIWASKRKDPMHFYSGTKIDPKTISDIPAYNRENSRMWKLYSIPYWLAGVCGMFGVFQSWAAILGLVLIVAACTAGIWWLLREYKRIATKYHVG